MVIGGDGIGVPGFRGEDHDSQRIGYIQASSLETMKELTDRYRRVRCKRDRALDRFFGTGRCSTKAYRLGKRLGYNDFGSYGSV